MTVTLTREAFNVLEQVTWDCTPDGRLRDNYSGRRMFGRSCLGLVVDDLSELIRWMFGVANAVDGEEAEVSENLQEFVEYLGTQRTLHDSMGLQQIFYWSGVEVTPRG
jgi:hypothetical protein